jgi:hypothetical protein
MLRLNVFGRPTGVAEVARLRALSALAPERWRVLLRAPGGRFDRPGAPFLVEFFPENLLDSVVRQAENRRWQVNESETSFQGELLCDEVHPRWSWPFWR